MEKKNILVVGSSGFIGSNLVGKLMNQGHYVTGIDISEPKYIQPTRFQKIDFRTSDIDIYGLYSPFMFDEAYCLACCMGGMGFIGNEEKYGYEIGVGSTQIVTNFIEYCKRNEIPKVFYSSSACVYNQDLQKSNDSVSLKESDAIPASPDLLYGWQKLFSEKMFEASGLNVRIARFHNIFGEMGVFDGGKEKAPGAIVRKVCMAKEGDEIEIWGDGTQKRSFLYISECLEGVERLMSSDYSKPLNIGSDESISVNDLAKMVIKISGKNLSIKNIEGNVGVQNRNSNNELIEEKLGWKPTQKLELGMASLYKWIYKQIINGTR